MLMLQHLHSEIVPSPLTVHTKGPVTEKGRSLASCMKGHKIEDTKIRQQDQQRQDQDFTVEYYSTSYTFQERLPPSHLSYTQEKNAKPCTQDYLTSSPRPFQDALLISLIIVEPPNPKTPTCVSCASHLLLRCHRRQ